MIILIKEDQYNKINIVNRTDLDKAKTWSPKVLTQVGPNSEPYILINNRFIKLSEKGSSRSSKHTMLSEKMASKLNKMLEQSEEYREESRRLLTKSDNLRWQISKLSGIDFK